MHSSKSLRYLLLSCLLLLSDHGCRLIQAQDGAVDVFMESPPEGLVTGDDDSPQLMSDADADMVLVAANNDTNATEYPSAAPSMMPTAEPTLEGGVTEECLQETNAFSNNAELVKELDALFEDYRDQFRNACPFSITSNGCELSFGSEPNITYHALCEEMGGQIYLHTVTLQCGVAPLDVRYNLGNVPQCIGGSCNITRIENAGILRSTNISNFGSSLDNGACSASISGSSVVFGSGMLRSMALVVVASTVLPTFLWATIM